MVLSKKVDIRKGGVHGYCWFAAEDIEEGEMIWELGDTKYNDIDIRKEELAKWSKEDREKFMALAYQVEEGLYRGSDPNKTISQEEQNEYFVNHSCDGNAWYENDDLLVAKRKILKDEEIVYDYALTESDEEWVLAPQCLCGAASCRQVVSGNDWKLEKLQKAYGNHFTAHIKKKIEQQKSQQ